MKKINFTDEQLKFMIQKYTNKEMTTTLLGKYFNCSKDTIVRRLKENGVQIKPFFPYEDLTNKKFGHLTVIKENKERYKQDILKTNKPHRYWWCKCDCGNPELIQVESSHLKNGHTTSCGCIKSLAEQKITQILQKNNINFKSEYTFPNLRGVNNGILRYDFAIFNKNNKLLYLIEYHGKQHYQQNGGWNTKEEFDIRIKNDNLKKEYAKNNSIPLIIIPYTVLPKNIQLFHLQLKENKYAIMA